MHKSQFLKKIKCCELYPSYHFLGTKTFFVFKMLTEKSLYYLSLCNIYIRWSYWILHSGYNQNSNILTRMVNQIRSINILFNIDDIVDFFSDNDKQTTHEKTIIYNCGISRHNNDNCLIL